ncbi:MAG: hypothetical protein HY235_20440 [Acidobacteria bacterium]|nr:hypothetical protein [Acidobacteriota bacterium]
MRRPKGEGAFVVHCSTAPFQPHFQDFLHSKLGLRDYGLIAIPGGVQALTLGEYLPKFSWAGWRFVKFLVDLDSPRRVVLIGHDDCRWYQRGPIGHKFESERKRQEDDLRTVGAGFKEKLPFAQVEMYFASMQQGQAVFDAVR